MSETTTMTVRARSDLSAFVASNVGESGAYQNISEYVRDVAVWRWEMATGRAATTTLM